MNIKKSREIFTKIAYYSFYLAVILEVLMVLIDKSAFINPIEGRLFQFTFFLFFIKVCLTKYSWKEYLVIVIFLGLGTVSYFVTGRNELVRSVMFLAACKDIDMRRCLKMVLGLTLFGCITIILLSLLGIGGAIYKIEDYGRGNTEIRYTLGMGHPNALQCMVWALTMLFLYLYGEKMKWYSYAFLLAVNVFFFGLTGSRTSLLVTLFAIIIVFIHKLIKNIKQQKAMMLLEMIAVVCSIVGSVIIAATAYKIYDYIWYAKKDWMTVLLLKINDLLTGRIRILTENDRWEGTTLTWSLFSHPRNDYYFDMGWIRLFYWYGIIPAVIIVLVLFLWMIYCYRKGQYIMTALIMSISLYTVFEAHIISVYLARNYLLFIFGTMWPELLIKDNWRESS